ncbi:Ankyrin repeat-containing protein [Cynara cardunculus var. scolymus]|uniref:Ankyrin repeat-containing protein n=1 Tax=Cynara cardunculus var. scolymus TaxID=59895 RepID=A0A103Y4U2_CYNCS|nr:Ankyrin repeat-containing protein [Cynara cardunculus var. scolymus]
MPPTYFPLRWESTGDQWWYASPIDWAAANGHYDLVRELLRLDGNHLIKLSSLRRIHRLEVVWDDEEQFDDVAKNRSLVAQKLLHEGDTKRGKNSLIGSGYGGWLLYTAASAGDLRFVQELLHKDALLVFGEGEYGVTDMLYAAARSKNMEVFRLIYDFAMSPRFMASNGRELEEHIGEIPSAYKQEMKNRAVHALARGGNLNILKELLGDCSNDNILDKQGNTALHVAASRGHISVVDILIRASPSSVQSKNDAGETFLHTAVTGFQIPTFRRLDRQIVLMKQLVCSKAFNIEEIINAADNEGRTALHLAINGNIDSDLVELLMTVCSINVNKRDNHGLTPLDLLKQRPSSASSEVLKRQLISAGAILSNQDYTVRKILASHLRKGSAGGSPGTTFNVADSEIFLHSGTENTPSTACGTPVLTMNAAEPSQLNSNSNSISNSNLESKSPNKKKHKGIKRFLRWPKTRKTGDEGGNLTMKPTELPVPLRQRYSKPSTPSNNKRSLAARSNLASPTAKKKVASGLVNGVMQAMPHMHRRSQSNSFSRSSISSHNSHTGIEIVGSSQMFDDGIVNKEEGVVNNRRSVNQYFCFGGSRLPLESNGSDRQQQHEIYDRYVLSTA